MKYFYKNFIRSFSFIVSLHYSERVRGFKQGGDIIRRPFVQHPSGLLAGIVRSRRKSRGAG